MLRLRNPCIKNTIPVLGLAGRHEQRNLKKQVRMADQAMYHQGNQSVFVGRLWTLLPPLRNKRFEK